MPRSVSSRSTTTSFNFAEIKNWSLNSFIFIFYYWLLFAGEIIPEMSTAFRKKTLACKSCLTNWAISSQNYRIYC
jgi:hypothetical protein